MTATRAETWRRRIMLLDAMWIRCALRGDWLNAGRVQVTIAECFVTQAVEHMSDPAFRGFPWQPSAPAYR